MGYEQKSPFYLSRQDSREDYYFMSLDELYDESDRLQEYLNKQQAKEPAMKRKNDNYGLWYLGIQRTVMVIEEVHRLIKEKEAEHIDCKHR